MPFIEVEVDLDKFDDAELLKLITDIWRKRKLGMDYDKDVDYLIYHVLGRIE